VAPDVIADAIEHRLAQIGLQSPLAAYFERVNPLKRLEDRFLDNVVRIGQITGPAGQSAARPALDHRKAACEQAVERVSITGAGTVEERAGGLGILQNAAILPDLSGDNRPGVFTIRE
jgi:hypothetical protein